MTHTGPVHKLTKSELADHIGQPHDSAAGTSRVAYPSVQVRRKWRLDELEASHRRLHGENAA